MVRDIPFWKNLVLAVAFFTLTPIALGTSLFTLVSLSNTSPTLPPSEANIVQEPKYGVKVYASLPSNLPSISGEIQADDARAEIVKSYLERFDSPLIPYADLLVKAADKHGLDFRLITAIAQQESNLCKKIPPETFNCWGWGIHSEGTLGFSSYEQGIEIVSRGLKEDYIDLGYTTPDVIMKKYTPLSPGSWAIGVNKFMAEMQ